jgi:hypothetical protein
MWMPAEICVWRCDRVTAAHQWLCSPGGWHVVVFIWCAARRNLAECEGLRVGTVTALSEQMPEGTASAAVGQNRPRNQAGSQNFGSKWQSPSQTHDTRNNDHQIESKTGRHLFSTGREGHPRGFCCTCAAHALRSWAPSGLQVRQGTCSQQ